MKNLWSMLGFLLLVQTSLRAQNEAELVKKVKAKLEKVSDYQATGKMKVDVPFISMPESLVTVYYKKPNKFSVVKQGGIAILPKGGVNMSTNALLQSDRYTAVGAGASLVEAKPVKVVKLLPTDENSNVVLTTLYIDEKDLLIRKTVVTTKENGTYEMIFRYGRYINWGLPDEVVFSFNAKDYKLPKGVTFDYEKGGSAKQPPANAKGSVTLSYSAYTINKGLPDQLFRKER
jgi:outer membrane lipoprotein-sorting protein